MPVQVVRVIIAGGLLKSTEALAQPTAHNNPRQQAAMLAPIKQVPLSASMHALLASTHTPASCCIPAKGLHGCSVLHRGCVHVCTKLQEGGLSACSTEVILAQNFSSGCDVVCIDVLVLPH